MARRGRTKHECRGDSLCRGERARGRVGVATRGKAQAMQYHTHRGCRRNPESRSATAIIGIVNIVGQSMLRAFLTEFFLCFPLMSLPPPTPLAATARKSQAANGERLTHRFPRFLKHLCMELMTLAGKQTCAALHETPKV